MNLCIYVEQWGAQWVFGGGAIISFLSIFLSKPVSETFGIPVGVVGSLFWTAFFSIMFVIAVGPCWGWW